MVRRVYQYKNKEIEGFAKKYDVDKLGYYEVFGDVELAIKREKRLKKFYRKDKIKLIEKENSEWQDLYFEINVSPTFCVEDDKKENF